ncbi:hypothetical protein CC79DRAFT_1396392 [Sarocladium strictum]
MQLKHLFVSFLAFGSAIAAANPAAAADHDGVEARGDSTKSCPQAMYYDKSKGKCTCSPGYYWETNSCRPRCGTDNSAYYSSSSDNCVCRNKAMRFNSSKRACDCGQGKTWDSYNNKCVTSCGGGASLVKGQCACPSSAQKYDTSKKTCSNRCQSGTTWNGSKCVSSCKAGTSWNGSKCVSVCKAGTSWNGSKCVSVCKAGTSWNGSKCTSICKAGETYNGSKCVSSCKSGETYNGSKCVSVCKSGTSWNGSKCVSVCKAGTSWNGSKCTSICKSGETYNGSKCVSSCKSGETWNGSKCVSSCKAGESWNGSKCISVCKDGATYQGNACQCPKPGYEYKNSKCVLSQPCGTEATLKSGVCVCNQDTMDYNTSTKKCACPRDYEWNKSAGKCTETCKDGATREGNVCKCPKEGYEYEYSKCVLSCGYEAHADNGACVCNQETKVFDTTSKKCACPKDTEWNKRAGKCTEVCGGESNYNTRTNACECSGGRVYENKACACPEKTIFKNGKCVPDCGTSAWYNTYKEECVCKTEGQEYDAEKGCGCFKAGEVYNKDKKACVPDCGTSAWYNTYKEECVCKTEGQEYDAEKGCGCFKDDETYDKDEKACLPNCGDAAGWSSFHKECRCRNSNLDYNSEDKTCGCKEGYKLEDKSCSPICPSDAKYVKADGDTPATCACTKDGYDWDSVKTSCVSKCPKDADWESEKCVCHNSNYEAIDGECKCPAGSVPRSRGRCEPACEHGADWSQRKNGCVCKEPNTKYTDEACVCAEGYVANADSGECEPKCPSSAYFKDGECHCKNSAFEFYETEDNGKGVCRCADDSIAWGPEKKYCKPNCGQYADWRGEKCVCKLKDSTYVEKDVECECKTGYSLNKVGECRPTCPDSADYSPAADGKEATCECRGDGLSYDKSTNSCTPICPSDSSYVKATETDPATCKCKSQSKKFEDGECVNKCPSDASYVPKDGEKAETCRCLSDYKLWNGESCKPKCADGQKPVKDEGAETFTCQCRDESKKAVGDLCKPKCPQDSTYAPKTDKAPETCKCDNKHLEYRNDECQCPEKTEPHGKFCVPICVEKSTFKRGRGCVCDDEKAELVGEDTEKKCQCIKGYVLDTNTGKCVAFCPSNADFVEGTNGEPDSCTCKNSELEYTDKECKCPKGSSLEGDFCKPDTCPKGAHVDKTTKPWSCACDVDGAKPEGEGEAAECKCPALTPRTLNGKCVACPTGSDVSDDGKSCVCKAGRYINHLDKCLCDNLKEPQGNKCQPNCGLLAKVNGDVCECYVKNAHFVEKDKSCPCPTGARQYIVDILKGKFECRCDQAVLKDSVFDADKLNCVCATGFKPVNKKCVPDCTAPFEASGNTCVCPTSSHKLVKVSGSPDKCVPLCDIIDPNPNYKRTPVTTDECYCDPAQYDWLSDVNKCSERCPTGFKHEAGNSEGKCICDDSTHGETDGVCLPKCEEYSASPPDRRRTAPPTCYCNPDSHSYYGNGVCVKNCDATGETHDLSNNYECFCDPEDSGEVEVDDKLECHKNCHVGLPETRKRTDTTEVCHCDPDVYDTSITGLCLDKCPRGEERKVDGDHECWCNDATHTVDGSGTCLPNCRNDKPLNTETPDECYCNEETQHAEGETCRPRCDPLQEASECFCDVESEQWEVESERCVKPCEGGFTHDTLENDLKCICDETKNYYDEDEKTCTPLCHANDLIKKGTPEECYCNDVAPSPLVKENGYCVEACTVKNQKFSSATPPVCECPADYYSDEGKTVCQPRCTDGGQFKGTDNNCYCDDSDPLKWLKVGDFCFKPCPKKNEEHAAAAPHACACPDTKKIVGSYCYAPCGDGDTYIGENGCDCPEGPTSIWEKVPSDRTCRKKCADTEIRDPTTRTCKCKTDATRPLAGATCECPANSKPKVAACECNDPANKEMFNGQCVDKCMDGSRRETRPLNYDYGKCVCSGEKSFYDTTAKKCKCPNGQQFRQGFCRATACPTQSNNAAYRTRYDEATASCICLNSMNRPDPLKIFSEYFGKCLP